MVLQNSLTGIVNLLSFLALCVATTSTENFLASLFIFLASIFLEAFSLRDTVKRSNSKIVFFCMVILFAISGIGLLFSFVGLTQLINVYFKEGNSVQIMVSSFKHSIYYFDPIDISNCIFFIGLAVITIPFILGTREAIIQRFRTTKYNLEKGLCGK